MDGSRFPAELCEALFARILVNDVVDDVLVPPASMQGCFTQEELIACFRLSRQLWLDGCDVPTLRRFASSCARGRRLDADELARLKHIRAKFKHHRFAHALYAARHRTPPLFDRVTILMGKLQDAIRTGRRPALAWRGASLRLLLTGVAVRRLCGEGTRLVPADAAGFRGLLAADLAALDGLLARTSVTGHVFHAGRKIVSRQVSFWITLHTLAPTGERHRIIRWLSAINGTMGSLHDDLVTRRAAQPASYDDAFALPDELRARIGLFADRLREALRSG